MLEVQARVIGIVGDAEALIGQYRHNFFVILQETETEIEMCCRIEIVAGNDGGKRFWDDHDLFDLEHWIGRRRKKVAGYAGSLGPGLPPPVVMPARIPGPAAIVAVPIGGIEGHD